MKYVAIIITIMFLSAACTKTEQHINTVSKTDSVYVDTSKVKTVTYTGIMHYYLHSGADSTHTAMVQVTRNYIDDLISFSGTPFYDICLNTPGDFYTFNNHGIAEKFEFRRDSLIYTGGTSYYFAGKQ